MILLLIVIISTVILTSWGKGISLLGLDHTSLMIQASEPKGDDQEAALSLGKNKVMLHMKSMFKAKLNVELSQQLFLMVWIFLAVYGCHL